VDTGHEIQGNETAPPVSTDAADDIAAFLYEGTILTEDSYKVSRITEDPSDNEFLGCAIEGEADYILSGDEHLLALKNYRGIQIVNADSFLKILERLSKGKPR